VDGSGQLSMKATVKSFGQELMITNIGTSDAGLYECSAVNYLVKSTEPISAQFHVVVECKQLCYHLLFTAWMKNISICCLHACSIFSVLLFVPKYYRKTKQM